MRALLVVLGLATLMFVSRLGYELWRMNRQAHEVRDPLVAHREVLRHHIESQAQTPDIEKYGIIHRRGAECPPGWKLEAGKFTESDGSHWDACLNPYIKDRWAGRGRTAVYVGASVDYLAGGEQMAMSVELRP